MKSTRREWKLNVWFIYFFPPCSEVSSIPMQFIWDSDMIFGRVNSLKMLHEHDTCVVDTVCHVTILWLVDDGLLPPTADSSTCLLSWSNRNLDTPPPYPMACSCQSLKALLFRCQVSIRGLSPPCICLCAIIEGSYHPRRSASQPLNTTSVLAPGGKSPLDWKCLLHQAVHHNELLPAGGYRPRSNFCAQYIAFFHSHFIHFLSLFCPDWKMLN